MQVFVLDPDDGRRWHGSDAERVRLLNRRLREGHLEVAPARNFASPGWRELMDYCRELVRQHNREQAHLSGRLGERVAETAHDVHRILFTQQRAHVAFLVEQIAALDAQVLTRLCAVGSCP